MTTPIGPTGVAPEPPAARVMRKYMQILNAVSVMGAEGFAYVIDTANPAELAELERVVQFLQSQIDRVHA